MALIDGIGVARPLRTSGAKPSSSSPGGWTGIPSEAPRTDSTTATAAASPLALDGMLALQAEADMTLRDRPARERGRQLLTAMAALQRALLGGGATDDSLQALAGLLQDMPDAADPALAALLQAIRLRARIELARRGH